MPTVTNPNISYGKGVPSTSTTGDFYKDLNTDVLYHKLQSGEWEVKPLHPQYKMYMR